MEGRATSSGLAGLLQVVASALRTSGQGAVRRNLPSVDIAASGIFNSLRLLLWFLWIRPQRDARQNLLETFFADATDN